MIKQLFVLCVILCVSANTQAEIITDWELAGASGNELAIAADNSATNVIGHNLTRGVGLGVSNAGNTFSSRDWDDGSPDEFFSFGFEVSGGFSVDLTDLTITIRSSNKGPDDLGLFYSGDSFAASLFNFDQPGTSDNSQVIDLSALSGLTGNIEFRILALNNSAADGGTITSGGTLRITNTFAFNGTVNPVPEPQTYAMFLAGLGIIGCAVRRKS